MLYAGLIMCVIMVAYSIMMMVGGLAVRACVQGKPKDRVEMHVHANYEHAYKQYVASYKQHA